MVHKIGLNVFGRISKLLYAGTAALTYCETKNEKSDLDLLKIIEPIDNMILVKSYKKVQRKYYPEKDLLITK